MNFAFLIRYLTMLCSFIVVNILECSPQKCYYSHSRTHTPYRKQKRDNRSHSYTQLRFIAYDSWIAVGNGIEANVKCQYVNARAKHHWMWCIACKNVIELNREMLQNMTFDSNWKETKDEKQKNCNEKMKLKLKRNKTTRDETRQDNAMCSQENEWNETTKPNGSERTDENEINSEEHE